MGGSPPQNHATKRSTISSGPKLPPRRTVCYFSCMKRRRFKNHLNHRIYVCGELSSQQSNSLVHVTAPVTTPPATLSTFVSTKLGNAATSSKKKKKKRYDGLNLLIHVNCMLEIQGASAHWERKKERKRTKPLVWAIKTFSIPRDGSSTMENFCTFVHAFDCIESARWMRGKSSFVPIAEMFSWEKRITLGTRFEMTNSYKMNFLHLFFSAFCSPTEVYSMALAWDRIRRQNWKHSWFFTAEIFDVPHMEPRLTGKLLCLLPRDQLENAASGEFPRLAV